MLPPPRDLLLHGAIRTPTSRRSSPGSQHHSVGYGSGYVTPSTPAPTQSLAAQAVDLELTHFYLTHTYKTLWGRPEVHPIWRDVVFFDAIRHPFLLNGLLAVAAMHKIITCGDPDGTYASAALRKQTAALEGFVPLLHDMTPEAAEVAFPMSILVSYWAFASRNLPPELSILSATEDLLPTAFADQHTNSSTASPAATPTAAPESVLTQFLELARRVRPTHAVHSSARETLLRSKLSPLMKVPDPSELPELDEDTRRALARLHERVDPLLGPIWDAGAKPEFLALDNLYRVMLWPQWGSCCSRGRCACRRGS
ncbi:unnamed protein product [Parascedosporium putredinis]|uniref:Uncharacterized protein n=1 Tax=Parascedosporium putredinis TaxID=1442378 RepID=A0A9P1M914_9PEZI|nr:unnamed protein product [Parascedosporium putredinis]CAI7993771.1 unnamed protein product [Parascedosporium putredinis]